MTAHLVRVVQADGLTHQLVARVPALLPSTIRTCILSTYDHEVDDDEASDIELFVSQVLRKLSEDSHAEVVDQAREVITTVHPMDRLPAGVPHSDDDALLAIVLRRMLLDDDSTMEITSARHARGRSIKLRAARLAITSGEMQAITRAMLRDMAAANHEGN